MFEFVDSKTTSLTSTQISTSGIIRQKETHCKRPTAMTDKEPAGIKRACTGLSAPEPFGQGGGVSDSKSPGLVPSQSSANCSTLGTSFENNTVWSLSPQLLDQADSLPLPGIEHLLDEDALGSLFQNSLIQAPVQETIPATTHSQADSQSVISESAVVQAGESSQRERIWSQDDSIVASFPRELHIFSLAEVLANQNIIDFNMERILNKIRVTGILQAFVKHRFRKYDLFRFWKFI